MTKTQLLHKITTQMNAEAQLRWENDKLRQKVTSLAQILASIQEKAKNADTAMSILNAYAQGALIGEFLKTDNT